MLSPLPISGGEEPMKGGAKRRGVPVKTLKKLLKKAGLKTSGKKAALTRRAKKARLMKGGVITEGMNEQGMSSADMTLGKEAEFKEETPVETTGKGRKRRSRGKFF
jgi:hypothetical protein